VVRNLGAAGVFEDLYRPADLLVHHLSAQREDSSTELHQWIRRNYTSFRELELSLTLQRS